MTARLTIGAANAAMCHHASKIAKSLKVGGPQLNEVPFLMRERIAEAILDTCVNMQGVFTLPDANHIKKTITPQGYLPFTTLVHANDLEMNAICERVKNTIENIDSDDRTAIARAVRNLRRVGY